jgi:hypothetical protein
MSEAAVHLPSGLVDFEGLRASGIWAEGCAPSKRTLIRWCAERRIPHVVMSKRIIRFDVAAVREHIAAVQTVRPVGGSGNVRRRAIRAARAAAAAPASAA